jgi:hypothetical protein
MFSLFCITVFCAAILLGALILNPPARTSPTAPMTLPQEPIIDSPPEGELIPLAPSAVPITGDSVVDDIAHRYREFWEAHPA